LYWLPALIRAEKALKPPILEMQPIQYQQADDLSYPLTQTMMKCAREIAMFSFGIPTILAGSVHSYFM
jgi:hypothetical protein